ncbi:hypothetical protein EsDP_00001312 [Epichloe bromicola]|uniref:DOMON domain-containing protein n=1 Tax=Epichloe bromicola TaxID=79588 RepID=A0ABQ0CHH3_9HYPO
MRIPKAIAGAAVAAFASTAEAGLASVCADSNDVCFQWGASRAAMNSGSGNVYFQLRAPTSYAWFALGTGSSMRGSSMFVVYNDGNNNVTLSTRRGQGHVMPEHTARSDVELLEGSGIVGGNMVANVRCTGCSDMDISSSSKWISAWKKGSSLDSSSPSAAIDIHDGHSQFSVNLKQASIASDSNPFLSTSENGVSSGSSGNTGASAGSGGNTGVFAGSSGNTGVVTGPSGDLNQDLLTAHGVVMAIVFIVGYPIGSSLMPLIGNWILHASWQFLAFLGMWAGFGIGYTVASRNGVFFADKHTRLGVIVCALMGIQPVLGWLHHLHYVKTQSRGGFSYAHIWYGRGLMILGIVNGGLGLQAANPSTRFIVAYSVIAGITSIIYTASIAVGISKRRKQSAEKGTDSPSVSDGGRQRSLQYVSGRAV